MKDILARLPVAENEVAVKINGREVPMGDFVQEIIKRTVLGMISSLKKADTKPGDVVEIKIRVK
jgi:sulfur carrier protein ThiS